MLALLDTATGKVALLEPRDPGRVSIYLCGPTVSGTFHLGHGRFAIVWDTLRRYLTWSGLDVRFVSNITDIEDKIIARAADEDNTPEDVAARYEALWWELTEALGVQRPDVAPHATAYVADMVDLIGRLVEAGKAYLGGDGVYFSTGSVADYGWLSHQDLDALRSGARVEASEEAGKRSPLDFAVWKLSKPGEPAWPSPWGLGRPGWHTECVVMSLDLLGEGFDLHLGGLDLLFPHHENERAQAVADGKEFSRRWVHNGMVVDERGEKMSKSLGNISSLPELLERYDGRALRVLVLQAHYRSPMSVTAEALDHAQGALSRLDNFARETRGIPAVSPDAATVARFKWRMDDDFDTPGALAVIFGAVRDARLDVSRAPALAAAVRECCEGAFGLFLPWDEEPLGKGVTDLVAKRDAARGRGDWGAADSIRTELQDMGYVVEDGPDGTVVRRG